MANGREAHLAMGGDEKLRRPHNEKQPALQLLSKPVAVPQSVPIHNTWWRRNLTLLAFKATRLLTKQRHCGILFILGKRFCVKFGGQDDFSEAVTMQFIAQHTSIPVPKVYCSFKHRGCVYIAMEVVRGHVLAHRWTLRSEESKKKILGQLKTMVKEMRSMSHPCGLGIANACGGSLSDGRLPGPTLRFGPFKDVAEFHRHLRQGWENESSQHHEVNELVDQHKALWPIHFTHADLSPLNIMVRGDEVTGIIDWETAGWFPSYWEYTNTKLNIHPFWQFWDHEVDKFLEPLPKELVMEQLRRKYFSDIPW